MIAPRRQHLSEGESDGDVGVVAAGVHLARRLPAILDIVIFSDWQRVDIGAHQQRPSGLRARSRAGEQADDAIAAYSFGNL